MPNLFSPADLSEGYLFNNEFDALTFTKVDDTALIELDEDSSILIATNEKYTFLRLEGKENKMLCVLRLKLKSIQGQNYYSVDKSHSVVKGKGYAVPLYEYAFCYLDSPIISDEIQTMPGSSKLWKKFQKKQEKSEYEIYVFNIKTNNQGQYLTRNYNDYDIWGWSKENIQIFRNAPDFVENLTDFENFDETTFTEFDGFELEDEIQDSLEINFKYTSTLHPDLEKFLVSGKKRLKDREHILLLGKRKVKDEGIENLDIDEQNGN